MSIITNLDDITLVDTPVTILKWTRDGHVPTVEQQPRAQLFKAENSAAYRRVTLVTRNVYGEPFCAVGRLVLAVVRPTHGRAIPWELDVGIVPPGKRRVASYRRDFPSDPVLLMWSAHQISLTGLPPLTAPLRVRCPSYADAWLEVARRCHATGSVWLDTVTAAIEHWGSRRR
jgi:hypothetical protein